ncbi:MAG: hypothetical protein HPY83_11900 [Anaerolineae bacterium]|nr:hypothetical protein [Anaerolineae bacterium]
MTEGKSGAKRRGPRAQASDGVRSDTRTTPSQAEGDRQTVEVGICLHEAREAQVSGAECAPPESEEGPQESQLPSQAEGSRETVEEDLRQKGAAG